jgi:hypothetical protein
MKQSEKKIVKFHGDTDKQITVKKSDKDLNRLKDNKLMLEKFPTPSDTKEKDEDEKQSERGLTNEDKAKLLTDFFKMAYLLDEGVLKHKVQEDKVKKVEKKQDSDDEERLVYILKDLEKDIVLPNRIYYMNNEDLKYNNRLRSKKQNIKKAPPVIHIETKPVLPEPEEEEEIYRKPRDIDEFYEIEDSNKEEKKECMII